jgi:outer membrane protein OmpU
MNNLKKVGLTALAGALVSVSANAADLAVTGGASISFGGEEGQTTGNGWSMNDSVTFTASGEMDNGWNVSVKQIIDSSDGGGTNAQVMDTRILTIDMGDTGVLTFAGDGGSSVLDAIDDVTPNAGEESWDDVTGADTLTVIGGTGGNNMFHYSNGSLMDGLSVSASYTPSDGATQDESSNDYGFKYTGIEGLTIGGGAGEDNTVGTASVDITNVYATYTMDAFSVGYQVSEFDSETANSDRDFTAIGISYAVSDDLSVSINESEVEYEGGSTKVDQEATGISVSYTMGSMSISANHNTVDNIGGTGTDDRSGYALTLAFAF